VNPTTDRRPTDHTVTKENRIVPLLRRFFPRLSLHPSPVAKTSADGGDTAMRAATMASGGPSGARTQGGGVAARPTRLRTHHRGVSTAVGVVAVLGVVASLAATPARAASPWWHLDTSVRPAILHGGTAADEIQQLTVTTEQHNGHPGQAVVTFGVAGETVAFATEPAASESIFCGFLTCAHSAAELQAALEAPAIYGPGNVTVVEPEPFVFRVSTSGTFSGQTVAVNFAEVGHAAATVLQQGRPDGVLVVRGSNLGNAVTGSPATLTAALPPGIEVGAISFRYFPVSAGAVNLATPAACSTTTTTVACSTATLPEEGKLEPYEYIEMRVGLIDESAAPGAQFEAGVSGGGAAPLSLRRTLPVGSAAPIFGTEEYNLIPEEEGGSVDARAGSHPYQLTATFALNQNGPEPAHGEEEYLRPPALARNLHFRLPPGQIGNATAVPQCDSLDFTDLIEPDVNLCPPDTAIGVATIAFTEPITLGTATYPVPLWNLQPAFGEPARFGFEFAGTPVILDTAVRSGKAGTADGDYGVTVSTDNTSQLVNFLAATVTFWGTPGDPSHDNARGWSCLVDGRLAGAEEGREPALGPCKPEEQKSPVAFLTLPTNCSAPFATTAEGDSWTNPSAPVRQLLGPTEGTNPFSLIGCNQLPFEPQVHSEPTSNAATSGTGLDFDIDFEDQGLLNPGGRAQSQLKKAEVTLPEGFTANPSVAEGLKACSEAEYEASTLEPNSGCNPESKIGEVEVTSPLVQPDQTLKGGLYVATQHANPNHNLLTLYMVARNAEIGTIVKQALKVTPNPITGQLQTEVDDVPQLPFSHFHLAFRSGQRSPLITPPACGTYAVKAALYPWSNPEAAAQRESAFQITAGPEGQGCPSGGVPPFHPVLQAGSENPTAGAYSPFYTEITRKDSEQEITRFSIKLPTGEIAKLKGVSECSDAQIALAKSREVEGGGAVEQANPACPANSEVGHTDVGTGVGNVLAYAPGKLYLAGPYHGSPISLVSVTAAKVGPFDLGTVVVRFAIDVNHETAEVSIDGANSDPIPHIVDGIPVHLRDIQAFVDRKAFTLNPTSCAKKSTASTVLGSGLNFASSSDDVPVTVSSPFQVASCASLGFKPKLALSLTGKKTHRGALPAFKAVLTYPKGGNYANIAKAQVTLPGSEFLEQGHLKNVCTRKVFETGANPGENCPKNSIYGKARAVTPLLDQPLEGPVYLRTGYGTKLPELAAALDGPQISITLAGTIDSVHQKGTEGSRIRNTFAVVPDAPVERFTLELKGGKKGLLVNSTDVCKGTHKALAAFTGQNGKLDEYQPVLKAQCGKGKKSGKKKSKSSKGKGGK
jgi:hypothetical protein